MGAEGGEDMRAAESEGGRPQLMARPFALNGSAKEALARSEVAHTAAGGAALPLSALLDPTAPVVDIDGKRLTESISWLYGAVQTLEERGNILGAHIGRVQGTLEGTLRNFTITAYEFGAGAGAPAKAGDVVGVDAMATAESAKDPSAAMRSCATDASVAPLPPPGSGASELEHRIWRVEKDVRRMLTQQERKHIVEEKLLGMRIDSLKCELEGRPSPSDLEGLKVHLARKLDDLEKKTREDVALLGSLLHQEGAADRRRILSQFEAFQHRQEAQWELADRKIQAHTDQWEEKLRQAHDRLQALDEPGEGRLDAMEARLMALEERMGGQLRSPASRASPSHVAAAAAATATVGAVRRPRLPSLASEAGLSSAGVSPAAAGTAAGVLVDQDEARLADATLGGQDVPGSMGEIIGEGGGDDLRQRVERLEAMLLSQPGTAAFGTDTLAYSLTAPQDAVAAGVTGGTGEDCGEQQPGVGGDFVAAVRQMQFEVSGQLEELRARLRALEDPTASYSEEGGEAVEGGGPPEEAGAAPVGAAAEGGGSPSCRSAGGRSSQGLAGSPRSSKAGADWCGAVEERLAHLERLTVGEVRFRSDQAEGRDARSHAGDMNKLRRSIELLAKLVLGPNPSAGAGGPLEADGAADGAPEDSAALAAAAAGVPPGDPLAWLERHRHSLNSICLGDRLRRLEGGGTAGGGRRDSVSQRLHRMETSIDAVDMEYLSHVKPEMTHLRREQEEIQEELQKQVSTISVALGCIEACLPQETRKAVQLFKKAAAMEADARPVTPLSLHLEGKILMLQEEVRTRVSLAEEMVTGHVDRVTKCVRDLERKQDRFMDHLEALTGQRFPPRSSMNTPCTDEAAAAHGHLQVPNPGGGRAAGSAPPTSVVARGPPLGGASRRPSLDPAQSAPAGWTKAKP